VPPHTLAVGIPAKVVRHFGPDSLQNRESSPDRMLEALAGLN
jgi:serine acetyltransferase